MSVDTEVEATWVIPNLAACFILIPFGRCFQLQSRMTRAHAMARYFVTNDISQLISWHQRTNDSITKHKDTYLNFF